MAYKKEVIDIKEGYILEITKTKRLPAKKQIKMHQDEYYIRTAGKKEILNMLLIY